MFVLSNAHKLIVKPLLFEQFRWWFFPLQVVLPSMLREGGLTGGGHRRIPPRTFPCTRVDLLDRSHLARALSIYTRIHSREPALVPFFCAVALELFLELLLMSHEGLLSLFVLIEGGVIAFRLLRPLLLSLMLAFDQFHEFDIDVENLSPEFANGTLDLVFDTKATGFIEPTPRTSIRYLLELVDLGKQHSTRVLQEVFELLVDLHDQFFG